MSAKKINIQALYKEMHYKPAWYLDKDIFIYLLNLSEFKTQDLLTLARLYIKYQPKTEKCELKKYFKYLLHKNNYLTIYDLYRVTRTIYLKEIY